MIWNRLFKFTPWLLVLLSSAGAWRKCRSVAGWFQRYVQLVVRRRARCFEQWEQAHPKDPRGPVFDAAAYLYSEFDRLRILQSQFFVDDRSFSDKKALVPDPDVKRKFEHALERSKMLADARLSESPARRRSFVCHGATVWLASRL